MEEEKKFVLNLTRLCGPTNSVTVDFMFETLSYINANAVVEAQFIEAIYLGNIFDDDDFLLRVGIQICSVEVLINRYEEAKRNQDGDFLTLLRKKHREAREFLNSEGVKQQIKATIEVRKSTMQNRAIWDTIANIFGLLQNFPQCNLGRLLAPLLPQMMEIVQQIANIDENNPRTMDSAANITDG
jgi:hypothetical protein